MLANAIAEVQLPVATQTEELKRVTDRLDQTEAAIGSLKSEAAILLKSGVFFLRLCKPLAKLLWVLLL